MQPDVSSARFNLDKSTVLLLDGDPMSMSILTQILSGFGAKNLHKCADAETAKAAVRRTTFDLILVDPAFLDDGYEFIPWVRRHGPSSNRFASIMIVTGHTQPSKVATARDSGANYVVAKPLTPAVMISRITWLARERRPHVDCVAYSGPDRRFKFEGPPVGSDGRRDSDLSAEVGDASAPNMSQEDIDALMQPRKVSL